MNRTFAIAGLGGLLLAACAGNAPDTPTTDARPQPGTPATTPMLPARADGSVPLAPLPQAVGEIGAQQPWVSTQSTDPVERWAELAGANLGHARGCGASAAMLADYRRKIGTERAGLETRGLDVTRFDVVVDEHADRAHDSIRRLGQRGGDVEGACAAILEHLRAQLAARPHSMSVRPLAAGSSP